MRREVAALLAWLASGFLASLPVAAAAPPATAADKDFALPAGASADGAALYASRCAACHDDATDRIPPKVLISVTRSPEDVIDTLTLGVMRTQATGLSAQQIKSLAFYLTGPLHRSAALAGLIAAHRAFQRQQELNEMKSNFVSSVSHELRAPIASMRLLAESLERGKIAGEVKQKEYFGLLVQESRRLSMLIENILDFSRIERGRKQYEFEPADLGALAEDTVRLMRPCSAERSVELDLRKNGAADAEPFACDSLALQQALINLIDNAIKHSPPGSRVAVGLDDTAVEMRLWVEDSGPGIPAEEHGKIFERFYRRGSELRRETQGIGIGLTIVKHIVEAHGGRVTVRSAPGQGSRFTMELPRP